MGRYRLNETLSQGEREWFDEKRFLAKNTKRSLVGKRRVETQRIKGVDEWLRIVATIIGPPMYFADSTNSIVLEESPYRIEYLLALLNSALFLWRFKLTSTNNNVATNELESMPFGTIHFSDPEDVAWHDRMVELVERMLALHEKLAEAKIERERTIIQHQIDATDRQIDRLVYELYGLTEEEVAIVEGNDCY